MPSTNYKDAIPEVLSNIREEHMQDGQTFCCVFCHEVWRCSAVRLADEVERLEAEKTDKLDPMHEDSGYHS
jgi:hypothetical protein